MKRVSLTIGIPAFNEEQNIGVLLLSILNQTLGKIVLKEILVYSDASTDKTNEIVERLGKTYPVIKLIKGKEQKGKYYRVNELFQRNKSDVLIILDADIALVGNKFIEKLATELTSNQKARMVVGHNVTVRPNGFVAKVLYTHFLLWDFVRWTSPNFDSVENFFGTATAYKKNFARSIKIPSYLSDPHSYIYLSAKKVNGFGYCREAEVLQYAPSTMKDLKKLLNRSIGKKDVGLVKIFGEEMVEETKHITTQAKLIGISKCFLHEPFYTPFAILLGIYIARFMSVQKIDRSPIWEINTSTKKPIFYAK